jgi:DMSO/TMAO reductase YedYZ molybdopterin-dependent catalytic subunit
VTTAVSKPSSRRYYQDGPPESVDLATWSLEVVDIGGRQITLSHDALTALPLVNEDRRMVCVCNWTIRHIWTGVRLKEVLTLIGRTRASGLFLRQTSIGTPKKGVYEVTIPLQDALDRQAILVTEIDGQPLSLERGYPVRLIDFGLYGYKCVKGLKRLEITEDYGLGEWEKRAGYPLDGTIRAKKYWVCDLRTSRFSANPGEITDF